VKQSIQDLIMIMGILVILTSVVVLGFSMPSQSETAENIRNIVSSQNAAIAIAQK